MKFLEFFVSVTLICYFKLAISQECMTPTQVPGACTDITNCPSLLKLLKREGANSSDFVARFICHFEGKNAIICCPGKLGISTMFNLYGPLFPPQCGFSGVSHARVVGGLPAKLNAWPWMAALGFRSSTSKLTFKCGGSLISARHVLTAAHCVEPDDLVIVRLGDLDLTSDNDGARPIELGFEKKIIHPEYNRSRYVNDVAILRLERDIQFTDNIHPICLPVGLMSLQSFVYTRPFIAGWGIYLNGKRSNVLQEVQLPVIPNDICAQRYSKYTEITFDNRLICTGGNGTKGHCKGDSGGPVMLPIRGSFYAIGVISYAAGCVVYGYPGVSSRVTSFLQFIISNLE